MRPHTGTASYVPLVGGLVGCALGMVAGLLALTQSLAVVALAWLYYRPLFALALLTAAAAALCAGAKLRRAAPRAGGSAAAAAPPPRTPAAAAGGGPFCVQCGARLVAGANYCAGCGTRVGGSVASGSGPVPVVMGEPVMPWGTPVD